MCVQNNAGVALLVEELKAVADSKNMKFTDNGEETKRGLEVIGHPDRQRADGSPLINVGVLREDGMGLGAGNLGLPGYQVALGFSEGSDKSQARHFADDVIKLLEQNWHVETVPPGSGAKASPDCK